MEVVLYLIHLLQVQFMELVVVAEMVMVAGQELVLLVIAKFHGILVLLLLHQQIGQV